MYRFTTTITILGLSFALPLAYADPPQDAPSVIVHDAPSVIVHFADLDLTHGAGIAELYGRLKVAAETVCAFEDGRDVGSQMRFKMCWQSALGMAVRKCDRPALTAYDRQLKDRNAAVQVARN